MLKHKLAFIIGVWFIFSAIIESLQVPENQVICGVILCIAGFSPQKDWADLFNGLIGAGILICGLFLNFINVFFFLIIGLIILLSNAQFLNINYKDVKQRVKNI